MCINIIDTVFAGISAVGEVLIAWVIFYEWEGGRLDHFLKDADSLLKERHRIYSAYCGLPESGSKPRNQLLKELIDEDEIPHKLNDAAHKNIRLLSRIGARMPTRFTPSMRKTVLDWYVVVILWVMLGPYVMARRADAGRTYAHTFLVYALESVKHLLEQGQQTMTVRDPDRGRKKDVVLHKTDLIRIQHELEGLLKL